MKKVSKKDPMFNKIKSFYTTESDHPFQVDVISNLIFNQKNWLKKVEPKWAKFLSFLKEDNLASSLLTRNIYDVLKSNFGRCDFKFTGNREYKNWIVSHNGIYFVLSTKSEVLLPRTKEESKEFYNAIAAVQYELFNLTLEFLKNNPEAYNDSDGYISNHLKSLEKNKIIIKNRLVL